MEYILWIALISPHGVSSQQTAVFPSERACQTAHTLTLGALSRSGAIAITNPSVRYAIECLPRG
jgi:hypothetical protein